MGTVSPPGDGASYSAYLAIVRVILPDGHLRFNVPPNSALRIKARSRHDRQHLAEIRKGKAAKGGRINYALPVRGWTRNVKTKAAEGWIARYIGEILLNIDDLHRPEAEECIQKAIELDERNGMMFELGRAYALYGEFFKRKGNRLKAQENLGNAIGILRGCGADGWVSKYEREMASIS